MSWLCTCHVSSAAVSCAHPWPDWIIRIIIIATAKWLFTRFRLWAHKPFVKRGPDLQHETSFQSQAQHKSREIPLSIASLGIILRFYMGMTVLVSSSVQNFKIIGQMRSVLWANAISRHMGLWSISGPRFSINTIFPRIWIPMLKIRRSRDRLIFNIGTLYW